jgi:3-oxosteroid 1-dehydrogenase
MHRDTDAEGEQRAARYDAVLVGATAGSLFAAIKLAHAGLRPVVLEKAGLVGGGTAYSGGIVWAPNNHRMRAKGNADSAAEGLQYLEQISNGRGDETLAKAYVDTIGRVLLEVESHTTLTWVTYSGLPDYWSEYSGGKPSGRFLLPLQWTPTTLGERERDVRELLSLADHERDWVWGRALIGALYETALALAVPVLLHRRVTGLISSPRGVLGVRVVDADGNETAIHADQGVLLNTGGFEWNDEWTARSIPGPRPHPQTPPSNEGDGHRMLTEIGAPLTLMDRTIAIPGVRIPKATNDDRPLWRVFFQPLARPHSLVVNRAGRRFANESFFVELAAGMQAVGPDGSAVNTPAYFIWDAQYQRLYGTPGDVPDSIVIEAPTLADLAARCGISAEPLQDEIAGFNAIARAGGSDPIGRGSTAYARNLGDPNCWPNPTVGTVDVAPYRAVSIELTTAGHRGGASIDVRGRVLNAAGEPIEGLYACGNVAAGLVTGQEYFSGASIGHALVFAALAAEDMLAGS